MGCGKEGLNKGAWTAIEDKILTEYIEVHGEGKWKNLSRQAGLKRCSKSCRLRWLNYLRPDIKRGNITDDEKDLIIRLHKLLGNRWSLIAGRLPGRTDNEIRNYWNTYMVKKTIHGRPGLTPNCHKTSKEEKLDSRRHPPISRRASPNNGRPPQAPVVHRPKPSRCTKVFFPTDREAAVPGMILNQVVSTDETSSRGRHDHADHHCQKAAETLINSPPLMISSGNDGFIMEGDFTHDFDQFLIPDHISRLFDFNIGFEADDNNNNASGTTNSSPTDSPLQNPNLFSVDYFLDSGMEWFY